MNSSAAWRQFICRACGLVYDEAQGDEDSGLLPGTRFEDIPDDWACPLCGVTKADFEPYDPSPLPQRSGVDSTAARTIVFDGAARITGRPRLGAPRSTTPAGQGTVVVVGGGTAAWTLVERIRQIDAERPITMVTACSADRYDKPRLSVAFRQGVAPADLPLETGAAAAKRLRVHLMAQTFAIGVDPARRRLRTTHGALDYGELVLAHGAQTRQCPGLPDDLTWRINDLGSYARLRQALNAAGPAASVLLVGAGLVGCELANDLALAGHRVTLIESAERPLPMATGAQSHELLKAWSGLPIRFLGGRRVRLATRGGLGEPIRLELQDGSVVTGHVLISAVGLATPSRLAQQAGLKWDQGIAVDRTSLSTGVAGIHALGDCISIDGTPQRFIEPIRRQASIVAARLLGLDPAPYDAAPPPIRVKTSSLPLTLN